jgi:hypothetical protein
MLWPTGHAVLAVAAALGPGVTGGRDRHDGEARRLVERHEVARLSSKSMIFPSGRWSLAHARCGPVEPPRMMQFAPNRLQRVAGVDVGTLGVPWPEGGGAAMGTAFWIGLSVVAWLALALVAALRVGRMVRQRDQQVPRFEPPATQPSGPGAPPRAADHTQRYLHGRS